MSELTLGQLRELAKRHGKEYGREFIIWAEQNGIFKSVTKINNENLQKRGFKNKKEYIDHNAKNRGYKNYSETINERNWNKGKHSPLSENEECSSWFGVFITENLFEEYLLTIFEYVKHMDYGNIGFDFICKKPRNDFIDRYPQFKLILDKEYKIQVESICLYCRTGKSPCLGFHIEHNNIADIFILSGWDNRESLQLEKVSAPFRGRLITE